MKTTRLTLILLSLIAAHVALAQGTVNFANQTSILPSPPDRLVRFSGVPGIADGTPISTNVNGLNLYGLRAQLFYGAVPVENSLIAVTTAPAGFRGSTSASVGTWFGGTRTLNGFGPGDLVYLQVRMWDTTLAADWATAMQPTYPGIWGKSIIFTYTVPSSLTPAPAEFIMVNFQGFGTGIPEPTAPAFFFLAAVLGFMRRSCRRPSECSGT